MRLRGLIFAGMMAGLAAVLQTAPTWLGEPAGYGLAILAALPAAMAAAAYTREAPYAIVITTVICMLINPQEAWVFLLTNGTFGLALGRLARAGWGRSVLLAAGVLLCGMTLLTWGIGVAALGPEILARGALLALCGYGLFALVWSALFTGLFRLVYRRVGPLLERPVTVEVLRR